MIERGNRGALNELLAATWLLKQGYDVFRNVSSHGDVDLIAIRDGGTLRLDVKGAVYRKDGSTPMDLWKDDLEPAVVKTIEVNMPDWREKQEMRKSIIGAFDKTFGTKEAAETGNG